ncbi:Rossmann-fold NAD(P)-binding domain-containing protein [Oceanivirga miroungae]|uniref:Shikimate dehydrogenase substrate binding domain-containing protein n=1 Tax=Oceanivirga miroungae TaxID=1130046 RepID=A0A6I8M779_9FUSO|nr:hypothetical protein [Oceanivirga miroungae]VWL85724.1 shikimate dehydrogenase substrate binding domain-containing protein [Oceanivirga miroungae]
MIYIVSKERKFNVLENILKNKNKEYEYLNISEKEFEDLVNSKNYEAIFVSKEYQDCLDEKKDLIYVKNGEIKYTELLYIGFSKFLDRNNINMNEKRVLLLGSNKKARTIYRVLKDKYEKVTVFIATISEELMDLEAGDRRIKKVEIKNMKQSDFIINATTLGNVGEENSSMLEKENEVRSYNIIDLIYEPKETALLLKYKVKGARIYGGLEIEKTKYYEALKILENEFQV